MPSERAYQEEQNGEKFSSVAPSSEELRVHKPFLSTAGTTFTMHVNLNGRQVSVLHSSSLENAIKLKLVPFCSS